MPMKRTQMPGLALIVLLLAGTAAMTPAQDTTAVDTVSVRDGYGPVVVGHIDGAIGPATRDYADRVLREADERGATCVIFTMDTPGGLSLSMRDIIKHIMASRVPVVAYTSPAGARAASAGALISLASHVAAMAPGTNIGAAHPVSIGGGGGDEGNKVMEEKVTNDAAAYARSLATQRGRNVDWAERVVRESISSTPDEALTDNVIDLIASSLDELITALNNMTVDTEFGTVTIHTAGAPVVELPLTTREKFLARISDPNIAYLLMLVGVFGLIFEFQNPGSFFPGVIGVVAIVISTFALQMLPVNLTGLALIILALIMFVLEIKIPSHGALTLGGVISMFVGSIMLIDSPLPFMRVSLAVIIPSVAFTALFFLFAVGIGIRAQRRKVSTGSQGLVGEVGTARSDVHERGSVFVHGEYWNAYSDTPVSNGSRVEVVSVEGMKLKVRAADPKEV
jgi:membrane-bound serine protease (ClpP class)